MQTLSLRSAFRPAAHRLANILSKAYVAGPELRDAVAAMDRFGRLGYATTLGYFNADDELPSRIAELDRAALEALSEGPRRGYVSIKVPALQFDAALVDQIALASRRTGVGIHFDSHGIEAADATFKSIAVALRQTQRVGCTLPARWQRSKDDAKRATELGLRVRIVKGQWADPAAPDLDPRANYLQLVDRLAGRARTVAVATHDPVLAREALRRLRAAGTPCELELLFGLPMRPCLALAKEERIPVCIYVPFGQGWMPYALSQLRKKPGMALWMMKDLAAAAALRVRG